MRNLLSRINWQWLLSKSIVEKNGYTQGLRQLAQVVCIPLGKSNHKSFKMWTVDKLYNLIVNKNRSLEINRQPKRGKKKKTTGA